MIGRITAGVFKSSWWLLILAVVLVAAYLSLGRIVAYSAASNSEQIKQYLKDRGLTALDVGAISGDWQVHDPVFELHNVTVVAEAGDAELTEPALAIDRLSVRLDSIASLFNRTPVIREIELDGLRFTAIREGTRIRIRGLPRGSGKLNLDPVLDSLPHLRRLELTGVDIDVTGPDLDLNLTSAEPGIILADGGVKKLMLPLQVINRRDGTTRIEPGLMMLTGEYEGDVRLDDFAASLYFELPPINLAEFVTGLDVTGREVSSAILQGELWLDIEDGLVDLRGGVDFSQIHLRHADQHLVLADTIGATFRYLGDTVNGGQLAIPVLHIANDRNRFEIRDVDLALSVDALGNRLAGSIPSLDIRALNDFLTAPGGEGVLPERLVSALTAVAPRGQLEDIFLAASLGGTNSESGNARVVSRLVDFSMGAYLGVPAIDRVNGLVSLQPRQGYLDIDNDAFQMNFASMFPAAWQFDSGRGRISYLVTDDGVKVNSGLIELITGRLESYGKVALNLPPDRDQQTWGLTIGITQADLLEGDRYIPNNVSQDLIAWLDDAVLGGFSPEAGLTVHGALYRGSPVIRKSHDLYMKVEDTRLQYHADWPVVEDLAATVHVNNHYVRSDNAAGRIYDSHLGNGKVDVPIVDSKVDTILVTGDLAGPFSDAVRALKETPLAEVTSNMASRWQGSGDMTAQLSLNVPIGLRAEEELLAIVQMTYADANLQMPEFDLDISQLGGNARYHTEQGLFSEGFDGMLFGRPVDGDIRTELKGDGGEIIVSVAGAVAAGDLHEWAGQVLLSRADGLLNYSTSVHVPYGGRRDESYVVATSDLHGLTVDLPYPLAKPDAESRHRFEYRQYFMDDAFRIEMAFDDVLQTSLKVEDGIAVGGRLHFGKEPAGAVIYDAIRMSGYLDHLDVEAWLAATEELSSVSDVSLEEEIAEHVASASLRFGELNVYSLELADAEAFVTRETGAWRVNLENTMLSGDVVVPDEDAAPLRIDLARINFEGEEGEADPLADVDPLGIADIDFSTSRLTLDGDDFGSWSFKYRVAGDTARFEDLTAKAVGVQVLPGSLAEWRFSEGRHTSRFTGDLLVEDLARALTTFGFASSVEGRDLKLRPDVTWPGSPAMVDVDHIVGDVAIEEGKGRFVQADTGGALKLLGVFDFASLARRFRLDFSDVVNEGFEFDDVSGVTTFNAGRISVSDPIVIRGSSGNFKVGGTVDLNTRELDNDMIVTLPVSRTLPWYAAYSAIATGPLAGAGVMLAQRVFENQINQMSSAKYQISGTIEEPNIEFVAIFDDKVRKGEAATQPAAGTETVVDAGEVVE